MGFLDSYGESKKFLEIFSTLADAAKTAADAYANKMKQPNIVVNVNYEPGTTTVQDVADAVRRAVRVQDR